MTLHHSGGTHGNGDGESMYPQLSATSWRNLWTVERTAPVIQSGTHKPPPSCLLQHYGNCPVSQPAKKTKNKKKTLKFTTQNTKWDYIIKIHLASGTTLVSSSFTVHLFKTPTRHRHTPQPWTLSQLERDRNMESEQCVVVLRDQKAWYNSWIPAQPHGDPWPASLARCSLPPSPE